MNSGHKSAFSAGIWQLGEVAVCRLGFGTKRLSGSASIKINNPTDRERIVGLLRRAVELGVNHFDSAYFYPTIAESPKQGEFTALNWANELLRLALSPYSAELVVATKVGPGEDGLDRPDQLRARVEADLRALGKDSLDLVYFWQLGLESVTDHFGELARLRDAGLIKHLGLSNIRPQHLAQAQAIAPVVAVQNRYSVDFGRVNDELLQTCGDQGIAFVPYFALTGSGREGGGLADSEAVLTVARDHAATPAQVRLAWTLSRGPHVLAIPGTSDPDHLDDNVAAGAIRLSADQLALLDRESDVAGAGHS